MADLAIVFRWGLSEMDPMPLDELMRWHAHAVERSPKPKDAP